MIILLLYIFVINCRLVEGFLYAAKDYKLDKIEMFEERFPDEITLAKVVAVWKYAVRFKEKKKKQSDV